MSEFTALRISRSNPSTVAAAGDRYWLRIVQNQGDDRLTPTDAADLVDALYDLDPCIDPATAPQVVEAEPVTEEKLYRKAAEVFGSDLASCRAALSGEYTETVKIIRSHPREKPPQPYQLQLSAGEVVGIRTVQEYISAAIDVSGTTSIDLEYPVVLDKDTPEELQKVKLSWQGDVIGAAGLITPPELSRTNNTIYWEERATGTIRAEYPTEYDVATIRVPGVPLVQGSEVGSSQDIKILAYWHLMVFPGEIKKPVEDNTVSKGDMRLLCGYVPDSPWAAAGVAKSLAAQTASDEAAGDPANDPDSPQYGCQDWSSYYSQAATYRQICCHDPASPPYACTQRVERRPGGAGISETDIEKYTKKQEPGSAFTPITEFIPVSPDDPDGCGTITWRLWPGHRACCDEVIPLSPHPENPTEISSGARVKICALGGRGGVPFIWQASGGLYFDNGSTRLTALASCVYVSAPSGVCASAAVRVTDGCSELTMRLNGSETGPLILCAEGEDKVISPGGFITFSPSGGTLPYTDWGSDKLIHKGGGLFQAPDDFCGIAEVTVADSCAAVAGCVVRSTNGYWKNVDYDQCAPEGGPYEPGPIYGQSAVQGGMYIYYRYISTHWFYSCPSLSPCGMGNTVMTDGESVMAGICASNPSTSYVEGCCTMAAITPTYRALGSIATGLFKWSCYGE